MDDAELEVAGLFDPSVDDPSRAVLVRRCLDVGLTVDEVREAGDDLVERAVQRIYTYGQDMLTLTEVADRAGVPWSQFEQIARATGLAEADFDEPLFTPDDVESMTTFAAAADLIGSEAVLQMLRVAEASVARIGDAAMSTFLTTTAAPALRNDESGTELLEANVLASELLPQFGEWMTRMLIRYLQRSYRPMSDLFLDSAVVDGVDAQHLAVGFADLVGSTTIADEMSLAELSSALDGFERTATETVITNGGRVVKFIGDEVMFRADDAATACVVALDLVDAIRDDPQLPPLRVGVAVGKVLSRDGDYFGPTVNLAARVTKLAPVDGVIVTSETAEGLGRGDLLSEPLGAIEMRGISDPVELVALSRP